MVRALLAIIARNVLTVRIGMPPQASDSTVHTLSGPESSNYAVYICMHKAAEMIVGFGARKLSASPDTWLEIPNDSSA